MKPKQIKLKSKQDRKLKKLFDSGIYKNPYGSLKLKQIRRLNPNVKIEGGKPLSYYKVTKANIINSFAGFEVRYKYCTKYGWSIVTSENFDRLSKYLKGRKVLDVAGGSGFITKNLRDRGIDIHLNDRNSIHTDEYKRTHQWTPIDLFCNAQDVDISNYNAFIMSWIGYEDTWCNKFIKKMKKGDILIVIGESQGGCCANDGFFRILDLYFTEDRDKSEALNNFNVQWSGIHDWWSFYVKN